jgi:hypothetical protein
MRVPVVCIFGVNSYIFDFFLSQLCFSACKDSQEVFEDPEGKSLMRTFVDVLSTSCTPFFILLNILPQAVTLRQLSRS